MPDETDYNVEVNSNTVHVSFEDSEAVLLNWATGQYYTLNETGARIWTLLQEGRSPADIAEALAATYAISPPDALDHVLTLVATLKGEGLLRERT